jgi:hypothetical protein
MKNAIVSAAMIPAIGLIASTSLGGAANAEAFKDKSGQMAYVPASVEDTKMPDGSIVRRTVFTGIGIADLPFPFDYVKHQCTGTTHISADGKPGRGHGYCEISSTKGDRASFTYVGESGAGRWTYFDGTGAYAGLKGEGTYKLKVLIPGGGFVNEWTGSWQTN